MKEEAKVQTGQEPVSIRPSRQGLGPTEGTWLVSFKTTANPFRLYGASALSRLVEKKPVLQAKQLPSQFEETDAWSNPQRKS